MPATPPPDEDGAQLWLRYKKVPLAGRLAEYQAALNHVVRAGSSATLQAAQSELVTGLGGLLGTTVPVADQPTGNGAVVLGTPASSTIVSRLAFGSRLAAVGNEGYLVEAATTGGQTAIVVAANTDVGVLRGSFALLRHLQMHRPVAGLALSGAPKIQRRLLTTGTTWTAPSSAATRAARSGAGAACRRRSPSATRTTRAPTRPSASTATVLNNVNATRRS